MSKHVKRLTLGAVIMVGFHALVVLVSLIPGVAVYGPIVVGVLVLGLISYVAGACLIDED
jgi:hypothetical protein